MMAASTYRMDRVYALRALGRLFCLAAVLVLVSVVGLTVAGGGGLRVVWYVLGGTGIALVGLGVLVAGVPPLVLRLDDDGYRLGRLGGSGVRSGSWTEVDDVHTHEEGALRGRGAMLITLASGETSRVPLVLVLRRADALQAELSDRLSAAHGYRRWTPPPPED
jgi:hypothetical protein